MAEYEKWDEMYRDHPVDDLPWEMGRPRDHLVGLVERGKVKPCITLDICAGAGTNTIYLAGKGFMVYGIDISETALRIAKERAERAGVKAHFIRGNFLNLPFAEEFEFLVDIGCFHNVLEKDREKYISEIWSVLKKGGKYYLMCFSDMNGIAWNHFSEEAIKEIFSGHFTIIEIEHSGSLENDGVIRYFYNVLMQKV